MQHERERHKVNGNHHQRERTNQRIRCCQSKDLEARRTAQKPGGNRDHQIRNTKAIPPKDKWVAFPLVPMVTEGENKDDAKRKLCYR
jgi:hypothetical protein